MFVARFLATNMGLLWDSNIKPKHTQKNRDSMLCRWLLEATGLSTHHRKPLTYTINFEDVISGHQMADVEGGGFVRTGWVKTSFPLASYISACWVCVRVGIWRWSLLVAGLG